MRGKDVAALLAALFFYLTFLSSLITSCASPTVIYKEDPHSSFVKF